MTLVPRSGVGAGESRSGEGDQVWTELLPGESTAGDGVLEEGLLVAAVFSVAVTGGGEPLRGVVAIGLTRLGRLGIGIGGSLESRHFRETTRAVIGPDAVLNSPTMDSVPSPLSFKLTKRCPAYGVC